MSTLRSIDEVRPAEFRAAAKREVDADMVAIAETIIERRSGAVEPASVRDRYQDALRELVESKTKRNGENASFDRRAAQGHQPNRSLEKQPRAGRRAGTEGGGYEQTHARQRCP
jgi:DNA end-binding protein Ku